MCEGGGSESAEVADDATFPIVGPAVRDRHATEHSFRDRVEQLLLVST